jgi:thiazole synthase
MSDVLRIGDREFQSRLLLGTGKFPSGESMRAAIESSRTQVVTVALRRVDATADG